MLLLSFICLEKFSYFCRRVGIRKENQAEAGVCVIYLGSNICWDFSSDMLRSVLNSCLKTGGLIPLCQNLGKHTLLTNQLTRCLSSVVSQNRLAPSINDHTVWKTPSNICTPQLTALPVLHQPSRSVTKWTFGSQKRQTVRAVTARFKRLDWGIWIRRIAGCHKKRWKYSNKNQMKNQRHVFVRFVRSRMLDRMVSSYWRTPKYYVDDPYAPYHKREEFMYTRKNPRPLPPGVSFSNEG